MALLQGPFFVRKGQVAIDSYAACFVAFIAPEAGCARHVVYGIKLAHYLHRHRVLQLMFRTDIANGTYELRGHCHART